MEVIWDSERFDIELPVDSFTVGSFKRYLSTRTGVPTEHMKLFCNAGLMKDDSAPLGAYRTDLEDSLDHAQEPSNGYLKRSRLWDGSFFGLKKRSIPPMRMRMVGSKETRAVVSDRPDLKPTQIHHQQDHNNNITTTTTTTTRSQPPSNLDASNEPRIIHLINELIQKTLSDNLPKIEHYEVIVSTQVEPHSHVGILPTAPQLQWDPTEFACLSEVLLQVLLKLDGFDIESEWTDARMARKEGVRAVQKLLDRLDHVKEIKGTHR